MQQTSEKSSCTKRANARVLPWNALILLVTLLSGCANFRENKIFSHINEANTLPVTQSLAKAQHGAWPEQMWWKRLGDQQLDTLMEEALNDNPTMRIAEARIRRAISIAGLADSVQYPQVSIGASSVFQRFSEHSTAPPSLAGESKSVSRLALDMRYDLDLWGKNKAKYESALGAVRVAEIEVLTAKNALTATIAKTYIQLSHNFEQLNIATAILRQREKIADLKEKRVHAGIDSGVELELSRGLIASAKADIHAAEEQIALLRNQLAALVGGGPDRGASIVAPTLLAQKELKLPTELPAELIGRRPDVVAQRWRIEMMSKEITAAKAEFYPNVNLTAFAGFDSIGIENILRGGSGVLGVGPTVSLPIFNGGRLRNNLAFQNAEYDESVERYNSIIVEAIRDVADQVVSWKGTEAQRNEQHVALARFEEANRLATIRYGGGVTNYLTVLTAEGEVLRERRRDVALKARQFEITVALTKALGGGYDPESTGVSGRNLEKIEKRGE